MEQHKSLEGHQRFRPECQHGLHNYYSQAKKFTLEFYSDTYDRILNTKFSEVSFERFFREYVWVVHTSGFSAKAVSKFWDNLISAYGDPQKIDSEHELISRVSSVVNNPQKIRSVYKTISLLKNNIRDHEWEKYRDENLNTPDKLTKFGHVGPITKYHLARNIGLVDFVKPDLHLERMSRFWGYESPLKMCQDCPDDIPLGLRDFILWMSASTFGTKEMDG